jgi:hypothetical protein
MNKSAMTSYASNELLEHLGLQMRPNFFLRVLPYFGVATAGLALGAGVAAMVAPKSGYQLRNDITQKVRRFLKNTAKKTRAAVDEAAPKNHAMFGADSTSSGGIDDEISFVEGTRPPTSRR